MHPSGSPIWRVNSKKGVYSKNRTTSISNFSLDPTPEDRLQFQTSIVHGAYQLRDWNTVLERTRDLVNNFEASLAAEQGADAPAFKAEKILNEIVLAQHFEFDQYATKDDINRILSIDELYLRAFDKWKSSQMPLYQYSHFLLKYKKIREASVSFATHWEKFRAELKEPLKEESLRNLVHAIETVDQEKDADPAVNEKRVDDLVKYSTEYTTLYPSTKISRPIAFLRTVALLKHDRNEAGLEESQKVFDANFNDDFGTRAFKNLRVIYYKLAYWKRTYDWASAQLAKPGIEKSPHLADLKTVREESLFLWADKTEDNEKAAQLYFRYRRRSADAPTAPRRLCTTPSCA